MKKVKFALKSADTIAKILGVTYGAVLRNAKRNGLKAVVFGSKKIAKHFFNDEQIAIMAEHTQKVRTANAKHKKELVTQ